MDSILLLQELIDFIEFSSFVDVNVTDLFDSFVLWLL